MQVAQKLTLIGCVFIGSIGFSQRNLSLEDASNELQKNNLLLLAEQYNISVSQAAVIQAKIWERPYFSADLNALNPSQNRYFDIGANGQKGFAIEQLIYLGGKKKNEVAFARSNSDMAILQFEQLLRNLQSQLTQDFYTSYFLQQKISFFNLQIGMLDTLVMNYQMQADKGNIPLKEVVRLQSLVLSIKNEKNDLNTEMMQVQQNLALLTGIREAIIPIVNEEVVLNNLQKVMLSKDELLKRAKENNLDYLAAIKIAESQELYARWQKSLAVPDLTAGLSYDQRGGAFQNQVNFTIGIPLPLWNSNKGNIKIAAAQLAQTNINRDYKQLELEVKVGAIWELWLQQQNLLNSLNNSIQQNMKSVFKGMVDNFQKRNISMLEFTDFIESFNATSIQMNEIKMSAIQLGIELNSITNTEIIKL